MAQPPAQSSSPERPRASPLAAGIAWATLLLAASNLGSRALGLLRDVVVSTLAGASAQTDAYFAAFQIPDTLNHLLLGGAITLAFMPLYTRYRAERGDAAAERLLHTVLGTLVAAMAAGALAIGWFAEPLLAYIFPDFPPHTLALTAQLTRIVIPAQICFAAGGVINAALLARGRFGALALAPLIYNACIIGVGAALYEQLGVRSFAWGVLVGALLGPLLAPLVDALPRVRIRARLAPLDPGFRSYLWIALPFMLGVSLLTVDEWYQKIFAAGLPEGSVSQLSYARKVMLVPVGVIGQALGTASLPLLSRLWAERRLTELERALQNTLGAGLFLGVLAAGGGVLLAAPLISLAFERGAFDAADAAAVSALLAVQAAAIPAWIAAQLAVRPFHARGDTWRPMWLGSALALAAFPLYWLFAREWGAYGLAAASVPALALNAAATLCLARRLHGGPALRPLLGALLRACAICAAALLTSALALRAAGIPAPLASAGSPLANAALLAGGSALYLGAAALLAARFAHPAVREALLGRLRRRRRAVRAAGPLG